MKSDFQSFWFQFIVHPHFFTSVPIHPHILSFSSSDFNFILLEKLNEFFFNNHVLEWSKYSYPPIALFCGNKIPLHTFKIMDIILNTMVDKMVLVFVQSIRTIIMRSNIFIFIINWILVHHPIKEHDIKIFGIYEQKQFWLPKQFWLKNGFNKFFKFRV